LGWPGSATEKILGDGAPWTKGRIPDALRKPFSTSGPVWPGKVCSPKAPGASDYCCPRDLSRGPDFWLEDIGCVNSGVVGSNLLVDARGRVLITMLAKIVCMGPENRQHWEIRGKQAALAGTPALVGDLLYATEADGVLYCYDLRPDLPTLRWGQSFCAAVLPDPSAIAANEDIVVSVGLDEKPLEGMPVNFSTHLFAMDATTGSLRWSAKLQMPSLMIVPSIVGDNVVCMASGGGVDCWGTKDGKLRWQVKGEMSMSTGGAIVVGQTVFAAHNRRAKKGWNAPFGGKGALRAYSLKDGSSVWEQLFDLEANCIPVYCPLGPGGKPAVIVCLGASPGHPPDSPFGKALGDHWDGQVLALDPKTGAVLWRTELPRWNACACAGNCLWAEKLPQPPAGWVPPAVGADGAVYANWNASGTLYVLDGTTGAELSKHVFGHPMASGPVIGPGMLFLHSQLRGYGAFVQEPAAREKILRSLEVPFAGGSGTEHFWPNKHNDPRCLGLSKFKAPRDLSNPAWVFKTPLKLTDCWYGNSAIMDAQRNIYIGGNWSDLFIIRPDGTLRGSVYPGPYYSTPCIDGEHLYVTNSLGWALCFRLDTLELKWSRKYTDWAASDNYCILAYKGSLFVPGMEFTAPGAIPHGAGRGWFESGHRWVYRLSLETGETIWRLDLNPVMPGTPTYDVLWNFTPVVFEEYMVFMDFNLGVYCIKWDKKEYCWHHPAEGSFSTGNQCSGSNGLVYITGNFSYEICHPCFNNPNGAGCVRAYDIRTGELRFQGETKDDRGLRMACNQGPVYVPAHDGRRAIVAVPFSTNLGGHPGMDTRGGDAFAGKLVAFDADTGEEVWGRQWDKYWRHTHVAGSFAEDPGPTWPDAWGGLSVDCTGTIYCHWMDGMVYAIDGRSGDIISSYDTGNSSNAQIVLGPGIVVFTGGFAVFCFRDQEQEEEWLESAKASGDPRAKAALLDIPTPKDGPPHKPGDEWRGPAYAEEQTLREGEAWIKAFSKAHVEANQLNEEWSRERSDEAKANAEKLRAASGVAKAIEWVVIGGETKGIMVREGKDLKSAELPRLQKGARVKQLKKEGERLKFSKLEGVGPDTGWVSLTVKGAPMLQPA